MIMAVGTLSVGVATLEARRVHQPPTCVQHLLVHLLVHCTMASRGGTWLVSVSG